MSFFSKILERLGIGNHGAGDAAVQAGGTAQAAPAAATSPATSSSQATPAVGSAAKMVLAKIAVNGGKVPQSLLD